MRAMIGKSDSPDPRLAALRAWLAHECDISLDGLTPVGSDASTRRYFRCKTPQGRPVLAVDAPPARENCRAYVDVAQLMAQAQLRVPDVLAVDYAQGFMLVSDLGRMRYAEALTNDNAEALFDAALDALVRWQCASVPGRLPAFDRAFIARELDLFPQWYLQRHRAITLAGAQYKAWRACREQLINSALAQPQVFMHRDFMPRNLLVGEPQPGIIDFQDAVIGPVSYDVVSLCRDALISWPEARIEQWRRAYWDKARRAGVPVTEDYDEFCRAFDWMGTQRHLKILGLFSRLYYRDNKSAYLAELPRFATYIQQVAARYPTLSALGDWVGLCDTA